MNKFLFCFVFLIFRLPRSVKWHSHKEMHITGFGKSEQSCCEHYLIGTIGTPWLFLITQLWGLLTELQRLKALMDLGASDKEHMQQEWAGGAFKQQFCQPHINLFLITRKGLSPQHPTTTVHCSCRKITMPNTLLPQQRSNSSAADH